MTAPLHLGTRTLQGQRREHPNSRQFDRGITRDVGMSKNVSASITFAASTSKLTAANGTFVNFVAGDPIIVDETNLNNGEHIITAIDATNQSFLTVDPAPKNEGPITATVRTP